MRENMRYVRSQGKVFAFVDKGLEGKAKGQLVGTNGMGSVLCVSSMGSGSNLMHYGPYGSRSGARSALAYNGERADRSCEDYALGNGYRSYTPVLMRFRSPDSWSPFGQGGINAYAYCSADPINKSDPSGHMSGSAIAGITLGVLGIMMSVLTIGMGTPLTASAIAGLVLGLTADVMGITSLVLEDTNPQSSGVIGWVALGLGLASLGLTMHGPWNLKSGRRAYELNPIKSGFKAMGGPGDFSVSQTVKYELSYLNNNPMQAKVVVTAHGHISEGFYMVLYDKGDLIGPLGLATKIKKRVPPEALSIVEVRACYSAKKFTKVAPNGTVIQYSFIGQLKKLYPHTQIIGYEDKVFVSPVSNEFYRKPNVLGLSAVGESLNEPAQTSSELLYDSGRVTL